MPLFKYGENFPDVGVILPLVQVEGWNLNAAEGDIEIPLFSLAGFFAAEGLVNIPALGIHGKTQDVINGNFRVPILSVVGEMPVSAAIVGVVAIHRVIVDGAMQADCSVTTPLLDIFGLATAQGYCVGDVVIKLPIVGGIVDAPRFADGNVLIPRVAIIGGASTHAVNQCDGSVGIRLLSVSGISFGAAHLTDEEDSLLRYSSVRRLI